MEQIQFKDNIIKVLEELDKIEEETIYIEGKIKILNDEIEDEEREIYINLTDVILKAWKKYLRDLKERFENLGFKMKAKIERGDIDIEIKIILIKGEWWTSPEIVIKRSYWVKHFNNFLIPRKYLYIIQNC